MVSGSSTHGEDGVAVETYDGVPGSSDAASDGFRQLRDLIVSGQARTDARFDRLEARFDRLETRFDRLEAKVDRLEIRVGRLETDVAQLKVDVAELKTGLAETNARIDRLEAATEQR